MNETSSPRADIPAELIRQWDLQQDPDSAKCPYHAADKLHDGPDIFYNLIQDPRFDVPGMWVVTRYELQKEVLQNPDLFSSQRIAAFSSLLGEDWPLVPLELDPPEHADYRALVNPLFAPMKVNDLEDSVRQAAVDLVEKARAQGGCEFMEAFGRPFPVGVFMRLMGLPLEEMPIFLEWEEDLLRGSNIEARVGAASNIKQYLLDLIDKRRKNPVDDLVSFAVTSKISGKPMPDERILGMCYLLFVGGLDTVAATLGFTFREMATQPEQQRQLRADPELIVSAVEEYVRAFGVVTTNRYVTEDAEFHGIQLRKGDRVSIPLGLASRDSHAYDEPHKIDFMRRNTRNMSFGGGPHRCLGSHLARREFKIALEEWTNRIPEFRVKEGESPVVHSTGVWGVDYLPLTW